jgi:5-methylcytosine-specific restriction endonuclease McrA|tara:strand:- start:156 stop:494 length:339 start_codon:yes stop_codon:yes gene_type:complete
MTGIKNKKYGSPGKLNPNWQGGLSTRGYPRNWSSVLKELIRRRDNYKCKLCGTPQEESIRKLPVHHIDYDKNNLKHSNLVTLCSKCNPKVNYNRKYWQKYFTEEVMPHECQA